MVLFFTSTVVNPPAFIYMGRDKEENEDLIAYGLPEDIWFHVDKLSSAHVYVRLPEGQTWDDITEELLEDCCQLVKANSIEGNKQNNIKIVYTPWENLKKTGDMATGQVGFHQQKMVRRRAVEKRKNEIVNRLNKTKEERFPDLQAEQQQRRVEIEREKAAQARMKAEAEKAELKRLKEEKEARSYDLLYDEEKLTNAADMAKLSVDEYEEDFM